MTFCSATRPSPTIRPTIRPHCRSGSTFYTPSLRRVFPSCSLTAKMAPKHGLFNKRIYIDAKDHLLGKLASYVSKAILEGNKVVVFNCDKINIAGSFYRNKIKYLSFLRKRCNVNPARGPFHHRAPRCIFRRTVRGMIPHKTTRGQQALRRMKAYEDIPARYTSQKTMVVPLAMRMLSLQRGRKYCDVGRLSHEVGWKYQHVVKDYEARRLEREAKRAQRLKIRHKLTREANKKVKKAIEPYNQVLRECGYFVPALV